MRLFMSKDWKESYKFVRRIDFLILDISTGDTWTRGTVITEKQVKHIS